MLNAYGWVVLKPIKGDFLHADRHHGDMATSLLIAALSAQIESSGNELKLLPAGDFRARDGRPSECDAWHLDSALAQRLIAAASVRATAYVVDYEHQTLNAAANGQPAPAAAWFSRLEWREGDGLYAVDVDWTARASAMIDAKEYRYLSPVFAYDTAGNVTAILHAALTNNPALDCLDDVQLAALSMLAPLPHTQISTAVAALSTEQPTGDNKMDELLEQLRWLLNMPVGATVEDVTAQLKKLIDSLSGGAGVAAASANLPVLLAQKDQQIVALSASQATPDKFVPIAVMTELRAKLDETTAQLTGNEVNTLVTAALSDGRLLPAQEAWARELGKTNIASLKTYLSGSQPIAALSGTQTGGQPPAGVQAGAAAADASTLAVCKALGVEPPKADAKAAAVSA